MDAGADEFPVAAWGRSVRDTTLALKEVGLNFDGVLGHQNFTSATDVMTSKSGPNVSKWRRPQSIFWLSFVQRSLIVNKVRTLTPQFLLESKTCRADRRSDPTQINAIGRKAA